MPRAPLAGVRTRARASARRRPKFPRRVARREAKQAGSHCRDMVRAETERRAFGSKARARIWSERRRTWESGTAAAGRLRSLQAVAVDQLSIVGSLCRVCLPGPLALRPRKILRQPNEVARIGITRAVLNTVLNIAWRLRHRGSGHLVAHVLGEGAASSSKPVGRICRGVEDDEEEGREAFPRVVDMPGFSPRARIEPI